MIVNSLFAYGLLNASLPLILGLYEKKNRQLDKIKAFQDHPSNLNLPTRETYDFIVVGAGSAGCILSRRLAARNFKVLLVEAGGDPPPLEKVSSLSGNLETIPFVNYVYPSVPQTDAALNKGGIMEATGGRMMGGSGSHNEGQYERGSPLDFDNWASQKVLADESWKYENVLKFFLKSENYYGRFSTKNGQHHKGGLLDLRAVNVTFRDDIWFTAGRELGYHVGDSNGPQRAGYFSPVEYNRDKKGRRVSTYSAFVQPIEHKWKQLTVMRYSVVSKVLFEKKRAVGILFERHGVPAAAFAAKEVILSAGVFVSPLLLIKSGIGPLDQLQKVVKKEEIVAILPVGKNLQNHVRVTMPPIFVNDSSIFKYPGLSLDAFNEFVESGQGALNYGNMHEAFLTSRRSSLDMTETTDDDDAPAKKWSDIQLYLEQGVDPSSYQFNSLQCTVNVNRPRSRGTLSINVKAKTLEESLIPVIDYKTFGDPSDIQVMLEGMEVCRKIVKDTKTSQKIGGHFDPTPAPECRRHHNGVHENEEIEKNKAYWKCFVRHRTGAGHVTSSVPMGQKGDPFSVLDSKMRVWGVKRLRVVDASVFPVITNANVAAPVMMIAEKAAHDILRTWRRKRVGRKKGKSQKSMRENIQHFFGAKVNE